METKLVKDLLDTVEKYINAVEDKTKFELLKKKVETLLTPDITEEKMRAKILTESSPIYIDDMKEAALRDFAEQYGITVEELVDEYRSKPIGHHIPPF
jgi:hypothetical protein